MNHAKTIQILLPDGDPKGIKIATVTSRTVKAIYIPRTKLEEAKKRDELDNVGVYILVGELGENNKYEVYIGEAENLASRLSQHNKSKEFSHIIAITSNNKSFTKVHVKYFEWLFCDTAKKINRCNLQNSAFPQKSHIEETTEGDIYDCFETIKILISTLGLPIFQEIINPQTKERLIFECKDTQGHHGKGEYTEEGFVIFKGALCRIETTKAFKVGVREKMIENKILVEKQDKYELQEDTLISSPSTAAKIILGRCENGWSAWKTSKGKTLDEIFRKDTAK